MVAGRLLQRLSARFVFVIGKGGVGKSTTSAALALASAEAGVPTLLLSTDPAHSSADVLGLSEGGPGPWRDVCRPELSVEEIDASASARTWFEDVRGPVSELVNRGTYLDAEDVDVLLDRALPGVDEVMAAVRIADLFATRTHERVVVDTAPTGHTLRLLDADRVLNGWVRALDAMADKAGAVGLGMTGRRIRFAGQDVVDRLRDDVRRFSEGVRAGADFVLVTRPDGVVEAESERFAAALRERGANLAAWVTVGADASMTEGGPTRLSVPWRGDLVGCDGLERWGTPPEVGSPSPGARPNAAASEQRPKADPEALFGGLRVLLFAGKGGVGKSTCAAATAAALAKGREVRLVSLDPAGSLGDVLGAPVGSEPVPFGPRLVASQLDAEARFDRFKAEHRERVRSVFDRITRTGGADLDRRVLDSVIEMAPPGIDEIFALEAIFEGLDDGVLLVLDTAPTGHFLRLISMPETALSWTRAVMRILLKYRAVLGLDDVATDLLQFARRLRGLREFLVDPERSGVVVVTLPHPVVRRETEDLVAALEAGRTPLAAILRNHAGAGDPAARAGSFGPAASVVLEAPTVSPPPVGLPALKEFADLWVRA